MTTTCRNGSSGSFVKNWLRAAVVLPFGLLLTPSTGYALFLDGDGYYALRGETRSNPAFSKDTGTYQAIEQSFRLKGEARFNDNSSMFLEFRLFDNPRESYLGDKARPADCEPRRGSTNEDCEGRHQNSGEPRYEPYTPKVTQAYVRYAFDYCILEAGRRGRNWGLGMFLDDGSKPFSEDASVYDGATCNVNIQKSQTLGFSVGYDKLAETGTYIDNPYDSPYPAPGDDENYDARTRRFGANDTGDDLDQYFFTIEFDDRKANAGATFTKQVGVYFAQINSKNIEHGGSSTDLKFLDLYTAFFIGDLTFRNEVLFRMGKSADPNWFLLGGTRTDNSEGLPPTNKLQSIAIAGGFEWTMSRSGAVIGPAEYNKGDAARHVLSFNYVFAPGDEDGYKIDTQADQSNDVNDSLTRSASESARNASVTAIALHRNFKPALLLFNARPEADTLRVDGAFNPSRVVNATVFSLAYMYESLVYGSYETKLVTAQLDKGMPSDVKNFYTANSANFPIKPVGYKGKSLGYELDLTYTYKVGREVELGMATAFALPGNAWDTRDDKKPVNEFMVQSFAAFRF